MKQRKIALSVLACLLVSAMLIMPLAFAGSDSSGSVVVGNAAPTMTTAGLYTTASANANNTNIDVNTEYWFNTTVGDANTLNDLLNVTFEIWESGTATENGSDLITNHYTYKYLNSTDAFSEVGPDAGGSHFVLADCQKPADRTASSGVYRLAFKLATTATYTATKTWKISAFVWDSASNAASIKTIIFGVTFYTLVNVVDTTHQWSGCSPGDTNKTLTSPAYGYINVTVTANGQWKLQGKGSADLSDGVGHTIAIGNILMHLGTLGSATAVTTSFADIGGITAQAAGASIATHVTLWANVPAGQASGTYTYTFSVQAVAG